MKKLTVKPLVNNQKIIKMNIETFKRFIDFQEPLLCIQGDIFETPADHIVFAVNYPNLLGQYNNNQGFAGEVCRKFWPGLDNIQFEKGEIRSHLSKGKCFHAIAVHTNEPDGWNESPELIESCLNRLPVSSVEVVAMVLIGGGKSGKKWKSGVNNIVGMSRSCKTIVLYIKQIEQYQALLSIGLGYRSIPLNLFPKTKKYRAQLSA
ncbi:MAG: hypothetical protein NT165_01415 [Candidatus Falkowbacteria bacterium]|nr:hypothetical protein [Candidatus Falkowbacteria bacterium]